LERKPREKWEREKEGDLVRQEQPLQSAVGRDDAGGAWEKFLEKRRRTDGKGKEDGREELAGT
jgi:hypothetical protein